jgi:hypothetical protein
MNNSKVQPDLTDTDMLNEKAGGDRHTATQASSDVEHPAAFDAAVVIEDTRMYKEENTNADMPRLQNTERRSQHRRITLTPITASTDTMQGLVEEGTESAEFGDSAVEGPEVERPQDAFGDQLQGTLEDDMEANAGVVLNDLVQRTADAMLFQKLEGLLLWLQVSSQIFQMPAFWPHVVFPSMAWLGRLLAPLTFSLSFAFDWLPQGWGLFLRGVFVFLIPIFLWLMSTQLWRDAHVWKLSFVDDWDKTSNMWQMRFFQVNTVAGLLFRYLDEKQWLLDSTGYTLQLIVLFASLTVWLSCLAVAAVLRALFSDRVDGRDQVDFFFWLRSKLQAFSLLILVIFYLSLVSMGTELLLPVVSGTDGQAGYFAFGILLLLEYLVVIPVCACRLIAGRRSQFQWLASERFHETNKKTGRRGSLHHFKEQLSEEIHKQLFVQRFSGFWQKSVLDLSDAVKDGLMHLLQKRHEQNQLLCSSELTDSALSCRCTAVSAAVRERSEQKQEYAQRLKGQIAASSTSIREQDARCTLLFEHDNGSAIDSLWLSYEFGMQFWKVGSILGDKALFAILILILTTLQATVASCSVAVAVTSCSLFFSCWFCPFLSQEEDRLDMVARLANFLNAVLALTLVLLYGDAASQTVGDSTNTTLNNGTAADTVRSSDAYIWLTAGVFFVNISTGIIMTYLIGPGEIARSAVQSINEARERWQTNQHKARTTVLTKSRLLYSVPVLCCFVMLHFTQ